ncbi:MAG TPA: carboxylating nicotinate-nucleotide diphosphorylase [Candidatus Polarisedimenticolia bacterium]
MIDPQSLTRMVRAALDEDLGAGDLTSRLVVPAEARAVGRIVARESLIVAGMDVAREVFFQVDSAVTLDAAARDGEARDRNQALGSVEGAARSILSAERTALNFLQRMSGIATMTRRLVDLAAGSGVEIADTRKTAPGLRALDKEAVRAGGGANHRAGLYDAILIKDNHWRLAGGVGQALRRARAGAPGTPAEGKPIEIEVGTIEEVEEALSAGAEALLLDNMDPATLARAIAAARGRAFLEVSGGVLEQEIPRLVKSGVDRISLGALTHSVRAADIALEVGPA